MRFTAVKFVVFPPALDLIGVNQAFRYDAFTLENCLAVVLDIEHILLVELEVLRSVVVQIARLPDDLSRHFVCNEFLPGIEGDERCESGQPLPLNKLYQV